MTFKEIQELIKLVSKQDLSEFKLKDGEFELTIRTDKYAKASNLKPMLQSQQPVMAAAPIAPVAQVAAAGAGSDSAGGSKDEGQQSGEAESDLLEVRSPIVGTFYRSPSPDKGPYVKVGDSVEAGSVVCIVEAMKLFNEIESEVSGKIVKVMVEDASPVQYDQVLYLVDPKG